MPKKISSYRDLEIWQEAMELVVEAYRLCDELPPTEEFGLKSQMKRASCSVASNIAEGHGRGSTGAYLHHLGIAHGSLMELETDLLLCVRLHFVTENRVEPLLARTESIGKKTNALINRLEARLDASSNSRRSTRKRSRVTEFYVPG